MFRQIYHVNGKIAFRISQINFKNLKPGWIIDSKCFWFLSVPNLQLRSHRNFCYFDQYFCSSIVLPYTCTVIRNRTHLHRRDFTKYQSSSFAMPMTDHILHLSNNSNLKLYSTNRLCCISVLECSYECKETSTYGDGFRRCFQQNFDLKNWPVSNRKYRLQLYWWLQFYSNIHPYEEW